MTFGNAKNRNRSKTFYTKIKLFKSLVTTHEANKTQNLFFFVFYNESYLDARIEFFLILS